MSVAGRIERLRLDTRRAIAKNMRVLQDQRRAAIRDGDVGEVARLQELIRALRRQRNDLSFRALRELEDSVDLRLIIDDLQKATKALHDEADNIKTVARSEEHTSELQSLMRTSYAVFCLKKKKYRKTNMTTTNRSNRNHKK